MTGLDFAAAGYAVIGLFVAWLAHKELARWADVGRAMRGTRRTGRLWLVIVLAGVLWPASIWIIRAR